MSDNQINSYKEELPGLGEKQKKIYNVLKELGPSSNQQLMDFLHMPSNQVTARVCELQDMGWVIPEGEVWNRKTNRYNTVYKALDEQLPEDKRRHKPTKVSGIYVRRCDAKLILEGKDVIIEDYSVVFTDGKADVKWNRAGVSLYKVDFISYNDHQLIFIVEGAKVEANIIG